jgi:hypothetical protein
MKTLLMMLLLLSSPAWAAWESVGEDRATTSFANPATIVRNGDIVRMTSLVDYKSFQRMVEVGYFSQKTLAEYDCAGRRFRGLSVALHAEKMGDGKVIYADETSHEWESVVAGSTAEAFWKVACR